MTITPEQFTAYCNRAATRDDLERANCPQAGMPGHRSCGVCPEHEKPRFECGCSMHPSEPTHERALDLGEPGDLARYAKQISNVRRVAIFSRFAAADLDPIAEQHLCIALDLLSQAERQVTLASLHQLRADATLHAYTGPDP